MDGFTTICFINILIAILVLIIAHRSSITIATKLKKFITWLAGLVRTLLCDRIYCGWLVPVFCRIDYTSNLDLFAALSPHHNFGRFAIDSDPLKSRPSKDTYRHITKTNHPYEFSKTEKGLQTLIIKLD